MTDADSDGNRLSCVDSNGNVRYRRFPVVTGYSGEGPFTEQIAATRLGSGNRSSCPHWHSRPLWRTRQGARQRHPRPGEDQNPLSCKYGPLSAVRAEGYTQFLGSIRPANRVERTRTNMSVGHAMKPMSEAHFAILRRHMVEVIEIQVDLASEELGKAALDERVLAAMRNVPRHRFVAFFLAPLAYQHTPLPIRFY